MDEPQIIFREADEALEFVRPLVVEDDSFAIAIADDMTITGQPDPIGAGIAAILDVILRKGFEPDGYDQNDGYRLYKYKRMSGRLPN